MSLQIGHSEGLVTVIKARNRKDETKEEGIRMRLGIYGKMLDGSF